MNLILLWFQLLEIKIIKELKIVFFLLSSFELILSTNVMNYIKTIVDIFSGAGGMSVGARMSGFAPALAVELDKYAAATYARNHPDTTVLQQDIKTVNPLKYVTGPVFMLFGGPPCQGFSKANTKTRNLDNPNNQMYKEYLRFVSELQPEWFVFENVEGFKSFDKGTFSADVEKQLQALGYETSSSILNSLNHGVPQKRFRYFIIGHRKDKGGIKFDFEDMERQPQVTVGEAISDLPSLENGQLSELLNYKSDSSHPYVQQLKNGMKHSTQNLVTRNGEHIIERYKVIAQGENWKSAHKKGLLTTYSSTKNTHSGIYRRLQMDEPAVTISNYRKSMLIHPLEDRGLSLREAARIQSFPDDYYLEGSLDSMQQQVGNAVPPLLAKAVFDQIKKYSRVKFKYVA